MPLMVSVSGIRGLVGEDLNPEVLVRYTAAFAASCRQRLEGRRASVVVGRDGRSSGAMILDLVRGTLAASGLETVDLGLCSTPGTAMAVTRQKAAGGIVITASHNPAPWNALKFLDEEGLFLSWEKGRALIAAAEAGGFAWMDHEGLGGSRRWREADRHHIDSILALPYLNREAVAGRGFKVAVDAVNAAGSESLPALLEELGAEVHRIHCEGTGVFPHNPEPRPANLGELADAVRKTGADLGLAVDPDADRLVLVDEKGRVLSEEYTLALAAEQVLAQRPGPVAANLSTSRMIEDVAARHGQPCRRSPVGEAHVVALMAETGAVVGGEGNGGIILPELHAGRDGLLGAALILGLLARRGESLSVLAAELPAYAMEKRRLELTAPVDAETLAAALEGQLKGELDRRDGIRADEPEGWLHLRPSNTEAILRLIGESEDAAWLSARLDSLERHLAEHLP